MATSRAQPHLSPRLSEPPGLPRPELWKTLRSGRELARRRAEAPPTLRLSTALAPVDELLAGGLPRGRLVELVGRRSSGRFSTVLAALAAATGTGHAAALVDLGDALDPQTAAAAGTVLERLLWVRPHSLKQALISAEMLLGSAFPLVAVDLGNPPVAGGRAVEAAWLRLARAAAAQGAALLVSTPYRMSGTAAALVVRARRQAPAWSGGRAAPRLLGALRSRLTLAKADGAERGRTAALDLYVPAALPRPGAGAGG